MNDKAILNTAITSWREEDDCYWTESPLCDFIGAHGATPEESKALFQTFLEEHVAAYKDNRHAVLKKPGRPAKGKVSMHAELNPEIKAELSIVAKQLNISQGEAVEYLFTFWKATHKPA